MGHKTSDSWFTISLNEPYIVIPDPPSISVSSATGRPNSQQKHLDGTVVIRLAKPTKVKSLSLTFSGIARTSFYFDSSSIPGAKSCVPCGKCSIIAEMSTPLGAITTVHTSLSHVPWTSSLAPRFATALVPPRCARVHTAQLPRLSHTSLDRAICLIF